MIFDEGTTRCTYKLGDIFSAIQLRVRGCRTVDHVHNWTVEDDAMTTQRPFQEIRDRMEQECECLYHDYCCRCLYSRSDIATLLEAYDQAQAKLEKAERAIEELTDIDYSELSNSQVIAFAQNVAATAREALSELRGESGGEK